MALSADRNTPRKEGNIRRFPVAAATVIFAGGLTCINAAGYATKGAVATTLVAVGRAEEHVDNSDGTAGAAFVTVRRGVFQYKNSAAADLIAADDIGKACYIVDDETVALTDGTATRSKAGTIYDVDAQGVWVEIL